MPDNIHQDTNPTQVLMQFHGMDANAASHLVSQDEVQSSTNVDYTLEFGAATVRRGSKLQIAITTATVPTDNWLSVEFLNSNQGALAGSDGLIYAAQGAVIYRVNGTVVTAIGTASGTGTGNIWSGVPYNGFMYLIGDDGSQQISHIKDNGTNVTEWIPQTPANALTITVNTLTAQSINGTHTFSISEGSAVGTSGTIFACDPKTFRLDVEAVITTGVLDSNGTHSIGDYGIVSVQGAFSNPKVINRVTMDFGIGTSFKDYYHTELDMVAGVDGYVDPTTLIQSQLNVITVVQGTTTLTNVNVTNEQKQAAIDALRKQYRAPKTRISAAKSSLNSWNIPRPNFETIFVSPNPGSWTNVGTGRIVIEGTGTFTATLTNWQISGATDFPLNDVNVGYSWWQTWAQIDANTGNVLGESAPSPASARTLIQNCNVTLSNTNFPTGTAHGITHRIFYRQGGYMNDAYAIGTMALGTATSGTATFTDTTADVDALTLGQVMNSDVATIAEFNRAPKALAEYYERLFIIASNTLYWSLPGQPATFPRDSYNPISDQGDPGMGLVTWLPRLVIINDHSVYEMVGNNFEGTAQDYTIFRTSARHGSKSRLTCIRTPYGIPLLDYDGIWLFVPGQGEVPLDWIMSKVGDMWLGTGVNDPAFYKGSRVPAIDLSKIRYACAAYANNRLYVGLPTSSNGTGGAAGNFCNTVLVADFKYQKCFLYSYPFSFNSLAWDQFQNKIYALSSGGNVFWIEQPTFVADQNDAGSNTATVWKVVTKAWPAPTEILMENLSMQYRGTNIIATGIYDTTNTVTLGSLPAANFRSWSTPTLGGTISNDVVFVFGGSQNGAVQSVYQIAWDAWLQPKRTVFYRTDYNDYGTEKEKIWDVHYTDVQIIGTSSAAAASILATSFIDNTAVATFTLTAATGLNEKLRYEFAYPAETYGNIEYTIYNASNCLFKLYGHHTDNRVEPPRITSFDSDRVTGGEQWWRQFSVDMNVLHGTVTAIPYIDEVAQTTATLTFAASGTVFPQGTGRTVFPVAFPNQETYGKSAYVRYSSTTPFKHYRTWYHTEATPDRVTFAESSYDTMPNVGIIKTWLPELQSFAGAAIIGTMFVDGIAVTSATFTTTPRRTFEIGLPNLTTGKSLKAVYSCATGSFKHWRTAFEIEQKPFYKKTWSIYYKKLGGATQLDMARFWEFDIETEASGFSTNTATVTATWIADGTAVLTNTFTMGTGARTYTDRISFPPGIYGYLFQVQVTSDQDIHVWRANMEIEAIGVKGFRRLTLSGTPQEQQNIQPAGEGDPAGEGRTELKPYMTRYQ